MSATLSAAPDTKIRETECFIDGKWVPARSGKTFATINPATEEEITQVAEGDTDDVDAAAKAARKAFESGPWSRMDARDRGRLMYLLADRMEEEIDESGSAGNVGQWQTVQRQPQRRLAVGDRLHSLLRRIRRQNSRQHDPDSWQSSLLHPPRTDWRGGPDHPMELSDSDDGLEVGAGASGRLHDRDEAGRANTADLFADGTIGQGGWHSRWRDQRRFPALARPPVPRWSSIR